MIPQAAIWAWFGIAWFFLLAVLFKHWRARESRDKAATQAALKSCKSDTTGDHIWDIT